MELERKIIKLEAQINELEKAQEKINSELERIINLHSQILAAIQVANAKLGKGEK